MASSKDKWNPISNSVRALVIGGWIGTLLWLEHRRTLRRVVENKSVRDIRNLGIAAGAGAVMQFLEAPVSFSLAAKAQAHRRGLVQRLPFPSWLRSLAAIALLDYTLYWWHFVTHRIPLLWRFHQVHHIDREMDATTALRFHFLEIALSVLFRAAQVIVIGPSPASFAAWQIFLMVCILFHHSNVSLPINIERLLARLLVTPRLHGIHHSIVPEQVNSNWSSGLTIWDWLHGTLVTEVVQAELILGVADKRSDDDQKLKRLLTLPFEGSASVPYMPDAVRRQPLSLIAE